MPSLPPLLLISSLISLIDDVSGLCLDWEGYDIVFLLLASHLKYMAGNLFSVWPRSLPGLGELESCSLVVRDRTTFIHYSTPVL